MQGNQLGGWLFKWLAATLVLLALLMVARDWLRASATSRLADERNLASRARIAAAWVQDRALAVSDWPSARADVLCRQIAGPARGQVALYRPDGTVIGASQPIAIAGTTQSEDLVAAREGRPGVWRTRLHGSDDDQVFVTAPIHDAGIVVAILRLTEPAPHLDLPIHWSVIELFAVLLVVAGLAAYVSRRLGRRLLAATTELDGAVRQFTAGDLLTPAPHGDFVEFETLAVSLNVFARSIDRQILDLTHQTRQWRALFTSMREGLVAVDRDFYILTINHAATQLVNPGADAEQLTGRSLYEGIRNADLQDFIETLLGAGDSPAEREVQLPMRAGEQTIITVSGVRFQYEEDGTPGALIVMKDITRLRRLETMRKEFVANVSHELKTPITSIKGYVETLSECLADDPGSADRFIAIILRQADHLNDIIEDLLYLSRLEQGDPSVFKDFSQADIRGAVRNAVQVCQKAAETKQIVIENLVVSTTLYANHRLLEHAVSNLLDNAIKYGPVGSRVVLDSTTVNGNLVVRVADNGVGIPAEDLERIFERFYRVEKSRNRNLGGTGLGLAIVKHIMRLHHGEVSVRSTLGKGSQFALSLPLGPPPQLPAAPSEF